MLKFKSQINFNCKIKKKKLQWKFLDERYFEKQLFVAKFESSFREIRRRFEKGGKSRARCTSGKFRERGAYWKVLRSIKSFSRVIITQHWFKPISPDDSRIFEGYTRVFIPPLSVQSMTQMLCVWVAANSMHKRMLLEATLLSTLIYLTRLLIRGLRSYLHQQYHFYFIISNRYKIMRNLEKLFREEIDEVDSIRQTQVRQTWRNFLKILIKKKYIRTYFRQSRFIKLNIFGCAHWQLHASIVRRWSASKDWIVSFFQRNRDSRDNSVMDIYISNFANAILCVVLYTFRDN